MNFEISLESFLSVAIKQRENENGGEEGGRREEWKNFKTIFTRWKKHVDDMFPSHVMKFLSSDDVEKLVFVFSEWRKQIFINLIC